LVEIGRGYPDIGELSEALAGLDRPLDQPATLEQRATSFRLERDTKGGIPGDPDHILDRERLAVQNAG
jgi:hypothetical protein